MLNVAYRIVLSFSLFLSVGTFAATAGTLETPAEGLNKILVSLHNANVEVKEVKTAKILKVSITGAGADAVLLERKDDVVELRLKTSSTKDMFNTTGAIQVSIITPPVATEVYLYEGQVQFQGLTKSALARNIKGKLASKDGQGELILSLQKGEIAVPSHNGSAKIESNRATVSLSQIQGDLTLENFGGDSVIDSCKGQLRIKTATGTTRLSKSSGSLQFEIGRGLITASDFTGRTDGEVQEATVNLSLNPESEMNLKNQNGKITITNNAQSSPSVSVFMEEGDLFVPNYLKVSREGNQKSVRGRLRGGSGTGSLVIRSADGIVTLR